MNDFKSRTGFVKVLRPSLAPTVNCLIEVTDYSIRVFILQLQKVPSIPANDINYTINNLLLSLVAGCSSDFG